MEILGIIVPLEVVVIVGVVIFILVIWKITDVPRVTRNIQNKIRPHKHRPAEVYQRKNDATENKEEIKNSLPPLGKLLLRLIKLLLAGARKK